MDITSIGIEIYAAITVICYVICEAVKCTSLKSNWLPVIAGVAGAILGVVGFYVVPGFPAESILAAIAVGIVSGIAATGCNQVFKQLVVKKDEL